MICYRIDETIQQSETAVFNPDSFTLYFRSVEEYKAWRNGKSLKLIVLWTKSAKPPKYKK